MPGQGRLGDKAQVPADAHGCPACPHNCVGPAIAGSPNVNVNSKPALRVGDPGMHAACCGPNMWTAQMGSATVFINKKAAHRLNDMNIHCGGVGKLIEGSANVIVGDGGGGGAGGPGGGRSISGGSTNGSAATTYNSSETSPGGTTGDPSSSSTATDAKGAPGAPGAQGTEGNAKPGDSPDGTTKKPDAPPAKVPADWTAKYDDGKVVKGFRSDFQTTGGTLEKLMPDGGGHTNHGNYTKNQDFSVALIGLIKVEGKVQNWEGNPVVGAQVHIDRAYGEPVDVVTDSNGAFKAEGFVEEEDYEVTITEPLRTIEGVVKDEEGKPVAKARVYIERSYGIPIEVETDADGKYKAEGVVEEEQHHITLSAPAKTSARIVDEDGKPLVGATLLVQAEGGEVTQVDTDNDGVFEIEGFVQQPHYALGIIKVRGVVEGKFVDEKGKPKVGVQARIHHPSGPPIDVTSDGDGNYRAEGLIPGEDHTLEIISYI